MKSAVKTKKDAAEPGKVADEQEKEATKPRKVTDIRSWGKIADELVKYVAELENPLRSS